MARRLRNTVIHHASVPSLFFHWWYYSWLLYEVAFLGQQWYWHTEHGLNCVIILCFLVWCNPAKLQMLFELLWLSGGHKSSVWLRSVHFTSYPQEPSQSANGSFQVITPRNPLRVPMDHSKLSLPGTLSECQRIIPSYHPQEPSQSANGSFQVITPRNSYSYKPKFFISLTS